MASELIGGVIIGLMVKDWLGRLLLPGAVGLLACAELFVLRRKSALPWTWRRGMKDGGIPANEIAETERLMKEMSEVPFRESGIVGWKLYAWQFGGSYLTTLLVAVFTGLIRDWFR